MILPPDQALRALLDEVGLDSDLRWAHTRTGVCADGRLHSVPPERLDRLHRPFLAWGLPVTLSVIPEVCTDTRRPDGRTAGSKGSCTAHAPGSPGPCPSRRTRRSWRTSGANRDTVWPCTAFTTTSPEGDSSSTGTTRRTWRPASRGASRDSPRPGSTGPSPSRPRRTGCRAPRWTWSRAVSRWCPGPGTTSAGSRVAAGLSGPEEGVAARPLPARGALFLSHPGCRFRPDRGPQAARRAVLAQVASHDLTVVVLHHWEFFPGGREDPARVQAIHALADDLAGRPGVRVARVRDLVPDLL